MYSHTGFEPAGALWHNRGDPIRRASVMRSLVFGIIFISLLFVASCSQTGGNADVADAVATVEAPATADADGNTYCDIGGASDAVCTRESSECGYGGVCSCPDGYGYNASVGRCGLELGGVSRAVEARLSDDKCVKAASSICTRDINICGQPSQCSCDEGFAWNNIAGKCLKVLGD